MKVLHINSYYSYGSYYKNLYEKQKESGLDIDVYVPVPKTYNTENINLGEYTTISEIMENMIGLYFKLSIEKYSMILSRLMILTNFLCYMPILYFPMVI